MVIDRVPPQVSKTLAESREEEQKDQQSMRMVTVT